VFAAARTSGSENIYSWLLEELKYIEVVDAHEHLPAERERTSKEIDIFTLLSHYTHADLQAAGMTRQEYETVLGMRLMNWNWVRCQNLLPLDQRWKILKPFYKMAKYTSYFKAFHIALKEFYGEEELTDDNYAELSEKVRDANKPGLYKRVLRDKCNIRLVLTQLMTAPEENRDILRPVLPISFFTDLSSSKDMKAEGFAHGSDSRNLEDYEDYVNRKLQDWKQSGVVGLKTYSVNDSSGSSIFGVSKHQAAEHFKKLKAGHLKLPEVKLLRSYLADMVIRQATELGLVIAVHTGMFWTSWIDFTYLKPEYIIPLLARHRTTKFDIYHAGIPWVREVGIIGKTFPNTWLNLCWSHVISQEMTCSALNEWIDLVPINKIIGFGGDYILPVEKVFGHLVMAKEDISRVLAYRVGLGSMAKRDALDIAQMWLYENPKKLYSLDI
jgi:hypothetical protein